MKNCVCRFGFLVAAVVACGLFQSREVRAAEVTISSGSAVVNCPGIANAETGLIKLIGQDFDFSFSFDGVFGGFSCSPAPVRVNLTTVPTPPYDGVLPFVTYQGVTTMFTRGSLSFDQTSISGVVEGTNFFGDVVFFTVNFSGAGVGSFSTSRSEFQVVPEPATIALMAVGGGLSIFARRFRKRRNQPGGGVRP